MAKEYQVEQEIIFLGMRENPAPYVNPATCISSRPVTKAIRLRL